MKHAQGARKRRLKVALIALMTILCCGIGGTFSWLAVESQQITNLFDVGAVSSEIIEGSFSGISKSNVSIKNTGNVEAYIRAAIVPSWENAEGDAVPLHAGLDDMDISLGSDGWLLSGGYYYFKTPVGAGELTPVLIKSASVKESSAGYQAGYKMNLTILCDAIQADGGNEEKSAVEDAWGVRAGPDGTLMIGGA